MLTSTYCLLCRLFLTSFFTCTLPILSHSLSHYSSIIFPPSSLPLISSAGHPRGGSVSSFGSLFSDVSTLPAGENMVAVRITGASLDPRLPEFQAASPLTFVSCDFYDFESACSACFGGFAPEYNFTAQVITNHSTVQLLHNTTKHLAGSFDCEPLFFHHALLVSSSYVYASGYYRICFLIRVISAAYVLCVLRSLRSGV